MSDSSTTRVAVAVLVTALCVAGLATALVQVTFAQSTVNVVIDNFSFAPQDITVVIGVNNTVTWTNAQSGVPHTVTANDGTWGSAQLSTGQTYTHTFTTAGTFGYHCSIHSYMTGNVIVVGSGATSTTTTTTTTTTTAPTTTTTTTAATTTAPTTTGATTSSTATSSPTTSSAGGIPEFPYSVAAVTAISALLAVSYFLARRSVKPGTRPGASPPLN
ncbi:MAG: cupredoxin domain-containing protein [Thaumarchaeota archaeon]|nr:cupredoxin domain-containing protein [Nitrososphaerota archaeon]